MWWWLPQHCSQPGFLTAFLLGHWPIKWTVLRLDLNALIHWHFMSYYLWGQKQGLDDSILCEARNNLKSGYVLPATNHSDKFTGGSIHTVECCVLGHLFMFHFFSKAQQPRSERNEGCRRRLVKRVKLHQSLKPQRGGCWRGAQGPHGSVAPLQGARLPGALSVGIGEGISKRISKAD